MQRKGDKMVNIWVEDGNGYRIDASFESVVKHVCDKSISKDTFISMLDDECNRISIKKGSITSIAEVE